MQDRCTVGAEHTIGSEIVLDTPDGTPRRRGSSGISFWSVGSQRRCKIGAQLAPNKTLTRKSFWTYPMELQGDVGNVESLFGSFGDSVGVGAR